MLIISKVFNNNVVLTNDDSGEEIIAMGKGLGFQKRSGDLIEIEKIDKVFVVDASKRASYEIYGRIDPDIIMISTEIIKFAQANLDIKLSNNIYLTLPDHLSFAVQRLAEGMELVTPLYWEVKNFYQAEFAVGKRALDLIASKLDLHLPEQEAASIALHIVNAKLDNQEMNETIRLTEMIQDILTLISMNTGITLNRESFHYSRFITHLRYFVQRFLNGDKLQESGDTFLLEQMYKKYPHIYKMTFKIDDYLASQGGGPMSSEERLYLIIHIQRLISEMKN